MSNLVTQGPSPASLARISAKMQSDWYSNMEAPIDRASLLSHATLLDGSPERVNEIPGELARVTPEEVRAFTAKYLTRTNRTIIDRVPAPASGAGSSDKKGAR
jgi:predicted Zn-dependent peptidase